MSDFEQFSQSHSRVEMNPFDDDSENPRNDIPMTEFEESMSDSDEFLSDNEGYDELYFESPHDIESQIAKIPLDTVAEEAGIDPNRISSGSIKKQNRSTLPTLEEEEKPEEPLVTSNTDLNESHARLDRMLDPSTPPSFVKHDKDQESTQRQISSSSIPETGDTSKVNRLVKGRSSIEMFHSAATAIKPEHKIKRRHTKHDFNSGARKPKDLHHMSRFKSKFLNDNEVHVIWKPDTSNITTASETIQRKTSASTMLSATDPANTTSWDQQERNAVSGSTSPPKGSDDLWLRQKQLQERVNIAREVAKNQYNTLVQPAVSQDEKRRILQLASKYVSYQISKKPKRLDDVVLHAMGSAADSTKQSSLEDSDEPLSPKQKWRKAVLLSANNRKVNGSSMTSKASSQSKLRPVSVHRIGQRMSRKSKKPFLGSVPQSKSDHNLTGLSKSSPPNKKGALKSRATYATMNTGALLEDVDEDENEPDKQSSVENKGYKSKTATNSTSAMATGEKKDQFDAKEVATKPTESNRYLYSDSNTLELLY